MKNVICKILTGGITTALFLSLFIVPAGGQAFHEHLRFNHLTVEDGLSQSTVTAIYQDSRGMVWFGTNDGLNKYNGYEISIFRHNPEDSASISYDDISDILEDRNGNLWIGTSGGGFNRYYRDTGTFKRYTVNDEAENDAGLTENTATSLAVDHNGYLWIGTQNGLNRFDPDTEEFEHYFSDPDDPHSLSDDRITKVIVDSQNRLWVGTQNGLNRKEPGASRFHRYLHDPDDPGSLRTDHIETILEDHEGTLWIATGGGGLNYYLPESGTFGSYTYDESDPESIGDNTIISLYEDSRGVLWIGGENNGLGAFDRENNRFYWYRHNVEDPASLSFDSVYSIYETSNHILWIGTFTGGLNYIDLKPPRFEHYTHDPYQQNPLSHNKVLSFEETGNDDIWIGTDGGGLNRFDPESATFETYRHDSQNPNSIPGNVILDIKKDEEGHVWLGSYNGGLSRVDFDQNEFRHYRHKPGDPNSLNSSNAFRIHFEEEEVWVGTHGGGLNVLNRQTGKFRHYHYEENNPGSLQNNFINCIYRDSEGALWFATHGDGIARFNRENETFTHYSKASGDLSSIAAFAIHEDQRGRFWVGTENGLNLFDRQSETYKVYNESDGLANQYIKGILEDDNGNLWLSTNNGISKFNPDTEEFENYSNDSGLKGNEFNSRAYYRDSEGYMYFGGTNGFIRFHPDNVSVNEYVSPVVFTDFMIFNQSVSPGEDSPLDKHISQTEHITLSHDQSVLTFEFVTLNYEINKNDHFAYMLEGFDKDWNYIEGKRSATYTNLDPGEYRLRVKASNSDGVWGEEEATLRLTVTPPFWRTTWFFFLTGLSLAGLVFGGYRRRIYTISERNKLLEQEIKTRTAELQESNSTLKETLDELQSTRDQLVEKAHKAGMADLATNVLHDVGNILNSVNVSTSVINQIVNQSRLKKLHEANRLLEKNLDSLEDFIIHDPRGKTLMEYYVKLDKPLNREYKKLKQQNDRLSEKINLIIDVVAAQQNYSMAGRITDLNSMEEVMEDTLKITASSFIHGNITVQKDYQPTDVVLIEKTKLVNVLVNILKNAVESIELQKPDKKEIVIRIYQDDQYVIVSVSDTGTGFDQQLKSKIFTHGFTTKPNGHGYGLHSCANNLHEMNGTIEAESEGPGKGAVFTIKLPRQVGASKN